MSHTNETSFTGSAWEAGAEAASSGLAAQKSRLGGQIDSDTSENADASDSMADLQSAAYQQAPIHSQKQDGNE